MNGLEMISIIARGLGPLKDKVVFVGGSAVSLYLTDSSAQGIRPTEDVDCVIEVLTRAQYYKFEGELEGLGFRHDTGAGAPICRWKYKGVTVDVMPVAGEVLDFKNSWYADGYATAREVALPGAGKVRVFSLPYFLASKIEAFLSRGHGDFLTSPDMEDILAILDGRETVFTEIDAAPAKVRAYLASNFTGFIADGRFVESLEGNVGNQPGSAGRVKRILIELKRLFA